VEIRTSNRQPSKIRKFILAAAVGSTLAAGAFTAAPAQAHDGGLRPIELPRAEMYEHHGHRGGGGLETVEAVAGGVILGEILANSQHRQPPVVVGQPGYGYPPPVYAQPQPVYGAPQGVLTPQSASQFLMGISQTMDRNADPQLFNEMRGFASYLAGQNGFTARTVQQAEGVYTHMEQSPAISYQQKQQIEVAHQALVQNSGISDRPIVNNGGGYYR